ncbi:MAG: CDP-alcohol phosphatidyltransferase family protein [archaeon]
MRIADLEKRCHRERDPAPVWLRRLSYYLSIPFIYLRISANQITFFSLILGIMASALFCVGGYWRILAGLGLLYLDRILDCVDGNIARYTKKYSLGGDFLDAQNHRFIFPLMLLGLGYGVYNTSGQIAFLFLGISASFFTQATYNTDLLKDMILLFFGGKSVASVKASVNASGKINLVSYLAGQPTKRAREVLLVAAVLKIIPLAVIFYGLFLPVRWVALASITFFKMKKEKQLTTF